MSETKDYGGVTASLEALKTALGDEQYKKAIELLDTKLVALREKHTDEITSFLEALNAAALLPEAMLEEQTRTTIDSHLAAVGAGLLQCSISDTLCKLTQAAQTHLSDFIAHMIVHYQQVQRRGSGLGEFLNRLMQDDVELRIGRIDFGSQKKEEEESTQKESTQPAG